MTAHEKYYQREFWKKMEIDQVIPENRRIAEEKKIKAMKKKLGL